MPAQTALCCLPSHGSFFSKLEPKSRAIQAVSTLKVKSSDQPARAELRIACCVTVVQQEHAHAAAALERQLPSANMAPAGLRKKRSKRERPAAAETPWNKVES